MTREQMIDEAVRDYMDYLDSIGDSRVWVAFCLDIFNDPWCRPWISDGPLAAIRFAYWRIKNEEEFRLS